MSAFPPELYDLVISNCERRSLISCGLVDRGWMELSRPHLFRAVMLNDTNYEGFLRLLAMENTTFRPLIRQLTISRPEADGKDTFFGGDFVQQLAVLDAVRRLRIFHVPWVGISASSIDTFGRVFRGITSLVLARTTFSSPYELICMLGPLRALEEIAIHGTFIDDFPAEGHLPKGPAPPAGLTTVRLKIRSNEGDPFTYLAMWLVGRPPPLRVLEAGVLWRESIPGVGALCSAIGAGLKELDLVLLNHVTASELVYSFVEILF
ncbi:hypothetical protein HMN09_00843200 [Mycena chlorophos]|uniref:F-box domain-containing protein n=1 Tax=Mycena chlorophos TaxID=658473 RepID=A0A8H6W691_MYCCL|nr:hypothetical protein HMN09_00843200 [Mycena chlorophos]